jgi:hypothetical protein
MRLTVETFNETLIEAIKAFEAGGAQSDDVTCLMLRFVAPVPTAHPQQEQANP